jgi:hypothetical protein
VLAGSLASFFRRGDPSTDGSETAADGDTNEALVNEIVELRTQVAVLADHVARLAPPTDDPAT